MFVFCLSACRALDSESQGLVKVKGEGEEGRRRLLQGRDRA